ncbi:MAG: paraslipin [Proteobacteria bacterium]|nr:paraslipin [Pseudomonadota bacterium]MBU1057770.1 paraslipin [Pseudomonadota bacterium]
METFIALGVLIAFIFIILLKTAVVVPQRMEYVVERLGKYRKTLQAGLHILIPFFDRVAYKRSMKEEPIDIAAQTGITSDNVTLEVDGVLYLQVIDAKKSAYGIDNYHFAAAQLAMTSLRSAIGKIELDKTFEARETLNGQVVLALDEAAENWGVKVLRYEIKDIKPPRTVLDAMEKQMKAEREKRAEIARSEAIKQSTINRAEGDRAEAISLSEGEKMKRINEAEGRAQEIMLVAEATAQGIRKVAEALTIPGGSEAANLDVAKSYIAQFGNLARENNTMIIPSNLTDVTSMVAAAMSTIKEVQKAPKTTGQPSPAPSPAGQQA